MLLTVVELFLGCTDRAEICPRRGLVLLNGYVSNYKATIVKFYPASKGWFIGLTHSSSIVNDSEDLEHKLSTVRSVLPLRLLYVVHKKVLGREFYGVQKEKSLYHHYYLEIRFICFPL